MRMRLSTTGNYVISPHVILNGLEIFNIRLRRTELSNAVQKETLIYANNGINGNNTK